MILENAIAAQYHWKRYEELRRKRIGLNKPPSKKEQVFFARYLFYEPKRLPIPHVSYHYGHIDIAIQNLLYDPKISRHIQHVTTANWMTTPEQPAAIIKLNTDDTTAILQVSVFLAKMNIPSEYEILIIPLVREDKYVSARIKSRLLEYAA